MKYLDILADLKNKKYAPVYFLMGEEPYYIDQIAQFIDKNVLDASQKEFDQTVVYGRDTDVLSLISTAKRYPMLSPSQVVILKEAQDMKNIEELENYITNPQPSTILVIEYKYKKVDKRKSFYKTIKKNAVILESDKLYDNKIPGWIDEYVKFHGYKIGPKASLLLAESLGANLSKVANEIDKLFISLKKGESITEEIIESNIGISKDFNIFELQSALIRKDIYKANQIANYFTANPKEHPFVVTITVLFNFFTKVLQLQYSQDESPQVQAGKLGVNPYFLKDYQQAAKVYSRAKIAKIISHLRIYDLRFKGVDNTSTTDGELLKELLFKILH
ncbi:MAG: DNA polymerase III subunit delta [Bacteroidales bacterium]|nr:DNA polymerase III subunit delta [Bacteroidales bacterium]